jgi:hypothetical protein
MIKLMYEQIDMDQNHDDDFHLPSTIFIVSYTINRNEKSSRTTSGGARGWQEGAEPPPERFEPPLESFETRIEIRKSYVMSAFLGAQPPPEYFLGAEPPLELFSGSATANNVEI